MKQSLTYGKGFIPIGKYSRKHHSKAYYTWKNMLKRCYDSTYQNLHPSYIGCTVSENWHNFQNFAEWYETNYKEGYDLDKDLLVKGNKIYSKETCCFVPMEINKLITIRQLDRGDYPIGVHKIASGYKAQINKEGIRSSLGTFSTIEEAFNIYKIEKENQIKVMANKYKDLIPIEVFEALLKWEILITD